MDRLSRRDLRAVLDFVARIHAAKHLDDFVTEVTRDGAALISADVTSYNEFNRKRRRINWIVEPAAVDFPESRAIFDRYLRQHPVLAFRRRSGNGRAVKITDLVSLREWQSCDLYNEMYRRVRLPHMLGIALPHQPSTLVEFALLRSEADFTERERAIMDLLRPHFGIAYRHAELMTDHCQQIALLHRGIDATGCAAIMLTPAGRIHSITAQARAWLREYFPGTRSDRLPENLASWTRQREWGNDDDEPPLPLSPYIVARAGKRLTVHLLRQDGHRVLLMEEEREAMRPEDLLSLGLTQREAEILVWVAAAKTDAEIATILDISRRTVSHTLERVYRKLGVESRAGATNRAVRAARGNAQSVKQP